MTDTMIIPLSEITVPEPTTGSPASKRSKAPKTPTACAMCGACCALVALKGSKDGYQFLLDHTIPNPTDQEDIERRANAAFIVKHMHPIDAETAARINMRRVLQNPLNNFYLCDWFDAETLKCIHHEDRPPFCQGFPFYGYKPSDPRIYPGLEAYPQCSFWADVPKSKWPAHVTPLPSPPVNVC